MENPGRNQVKDKLVFAHHQRVAGVVSSLIAGHHLGLPGQKIDDLPLAFISPLGAHHDYVRQNFTLLFTNPYY
jgi:hypothetical protein